MCFSMHQTGCFAQALLTIRFASGVSAKARHDHAFFSRFSLLGLLTGLLFLSASLTPSLLPRVPLVQGVLGGFAFAVGYGTGRFAEFLWWALELPPLAGRIRRMVLAVLIAGAAVLTLITFSHMQVWQDSIRVRM